MGSGRSGLYSGTHGSKAKITKMPGKKSGGTSKTTFAGNAKKASKKYNLNKSGYFGEKGKNCRLIYSDDPVKTSTDFYRTLSKGGKESKLSNGKGVQTVFDDGTRIVHRINTSTPGSPAVDITITKSSSVKSQKIHFKKKEQS